LKVVSKGFVVSQGQQRNIIAEKDIQLQCDSPFIVKLFETFNSPQNLYFLMELCEGGDLYSTYWKKGFHGCIPHARFYIAGVLCAFEHMHAKKIAYRDLKPENLMLDSRGHLKVTDMGFAKVIAGKSFTVCGTTDYFAPEIIAGTGHTIAVDWWTLGVLAYELVAGSAPFESPQPMQTFEKIKLGVHPAFQLHPRVNGPLADLFRGLCYSDPSQRIPMRQGGADNIRQHEWYQGFPWNAFHTLQMEPPYKPTQKNRNDSANFSNSKAKKPPQISYVDDGTRWDSAFATSE